MSHDKATLRPESDSPEDQAFMRRLFNTLDDVQFLHNFGPQAEALIDMQLRAREQQFRAQYPQAAFQLILLDGEPVGRLATDRVSDEWCLIDIAVLPEHRSKGIGGRLVREMFRDAEQAGRPVSASVRANNEGAQRLWLKLGFAVTEERADYWFLRYDPQAERDA